MENDQTIEVSRSYSFTVVPDDVLNDSRLSWKAKGILGYLLGKPKNWKTRRSDLMKRATDGETSVRTGLKELRDAGYAKLIRRHGDAGKVREWVWSVADRPIFLKPDVENPHVGNPHVGNAPNSKKERSKKEKRTKGVSSKVVIPESLNTPEFAEQWSDYEDHRRQMRKPLTDAARSRTLKQLERWGHDPAIRALDHSMQKSWQGVFLAPEDEGLKKADKPTKKKSAGRKLSDLVNA